MKIHGAVFLAIVFLVGCSHPQSESRAVYTKTVKADLDVRHLFSRAWRVSPSAYGEASGSIYVFLPNGTLLETSCVETYRIATWKVDPANDGKLVIQEDNRPAFTATFSAADDNTMHMTQALMLGQREVKDITLTGIEKEFVCPDMKK